MQNVKIILPNDVLILAAKATELNGGEEIDWYIDSSDDQLILNNADIVDPPHKREFRICEFYNFVEDTSSYSLMHSVWVDEKHTETHCYTIGQNGEMNYTEYKH